MKQDLRSTTVSPPKRRERAVPPPLSLPRPDPFRSFNPTRDGRQVVCDSTCTASQVASGRPRHPDHDGYRRLNQFATEAKRAMGTAGTVATTHGDPGLAWADDQRVRQILRNLLTNARRYGGPAIRLEFSRNSNWVEADNGSGIPLEMQQSMFESYQSSHKPDAGVRSIGLGLYISRNLATAMGGQLEYSYDGVWSRFRLRLRASRPEGSSIS